MNERCGRGFPNEIKHYAVIQRFEIALRIQTNPIVENESSVSWFMVHGRQIIHLTSKACASPHKSKYDSYFLGRAALMWHHAADIDNAETHGAAMGRT